MIQRPTQRRAIEADQLPLPMFLPPTAAEAQAQDETDYAEITDVIFYVDGPEIQANVDELVNIDAYLRARAS